MTAVDPFNSRSRMEFWQKMERLFSFPFSALRYFIRDPARLHCTVFTVCCKKAGLDNPLSLLTRDTIGYIRAFIASNTRLERLRRIKMEGPPTPSDLTRVKSAWKLSVNMAIVHPKLASIVLSDDKTRVEFPAPLYRHLPMGCWRCFAVFGMDRQDAALVQKCDPPAPFVSTVSPARLCNLCIGSLLGFINTPTHRHVLQWESPGILAIALDMDPLSPILSITMTCHMFGGTEEQRVSAERPKVDEVLESLRCTPILKIAFPGAAHWGDAALARGSEYFIREWLSRHGNALSSIGAEALSIKQLTRNALQLCRERQAQLEEHGRSNELVKYEGLLVSEDHLRRRELCMRARDRRLAWENKHGKRRFQRKRSRKKAKKSPDEKTVDAYKQWLAEVTQAPDAKREDVLGRTLLRKKHRAR